MLFVNKIKNNLSILKDRKFWLFTGSGLIVSVAYMDPGNWGTNISGGANFEYKLLWVIWLASGMAMMFQYLSGKIGIAGYSVAELVKEKLKRKSLIVAYWLLSELVILATDLAEFLGIAFQASACYQGFYRRSAPHPSAPRHLAAPRMRNQTSSPPAALSGAASGRSSPQARD